MRLPASSLQWPAVELPRSSGNRKRSEVKAETRQDWECSSPDIMAHGRFRGRMKGNDKENEGLASTYSRNKSEKHGG